MLKFLLKTALAAAAVGLGLNALKTVEQKTQKDSKTEKDESGKEEHEELH